MLLTSLLLAACLQVSAPEATGPFQPGWQDVQFVDTHFGQTDVQGRIYYPALTSGENAPADPSGGPYPVLAHIHGWLSSASGYDDLCNHLASRGYLVASVDTERGFWADTTELAWDTRALLYWVEDGSADPAHWLAGMARGGDWAASGHSMGGGTLSLLIGIEPRVRTLLLLQPAAPNPVGTANLRAFTGQTIWIAGSEDGIVLPQTVEEGYELAVRADRRVYFNVIGMGHSGCHDSRPNNEGLPADEQFRIHKRIMTAVLDAESHGADREYEWLFGEGLSWQEPWRHRQQCVRPIFWGGYQPTALGVEMGIVAVGGATTMVAWSPNLGASPTPLGISGLDLSLASTGPALPLDHRAHTSWSQLLDPAYSGSTLHFQAGAFGWKQGGLIGVLTEVLSVAVP